MKPRDYLEAARVPHSIEPQTFGLWTIRRVSASEGKTPFQRAWMEVQIGWPDYTLLHRMTDGSAMQEFGEIVMEDSLHELRRHLPIWLAAHGRVLVSGLGLGCVVRGLLASPRVEHIDVVEIDSGILLVVGPEFLGNPRVTLHHGDSVTYEWPEGTRWDFAWHDVCDGEERSTQLLHGDLIARYYGIVTRQGAWMFPRIAKRVLPLSRFIP